MREVYERNVPHLLSEKKFWEIYLQSKFFHRTREQNTPSKSGGTKQTHQEDIFSPYESSIQEDRIAPEVRLDLLERALDLSKEEEGTEGFSMSLDENMASRHLEKAITLIRRYNRHAVLVLENPEVHDYEGMSRRSTNRPPLTVGVKRPYLSSEDEVNRKRLCQSLRDQTTLADLEEEQHLAIIPLKIEDQRRYFQGASNGTDISEEEQTELIQGFNSTLGQWDCNLSQAVSSLSLGQTCSQILFSVTLPKSRGDGDTQKAVSLDAEFEKRLRSDFLETNELLRHFWGAFPLTSSTKRAKAQRLEKVLSTRYDELFQKRNDLIRSENPQEKEYGNLLLPLVNSVLKAVAFFEEKVTPHLAN